MLSCKDFKIDTSLIVSLKYDRIYIEGMELMTSKQFQFTFGL